MVGRKVALWAVLVHDLPQLRMEVRMVRLAPWVVEGLAPWVVEGLQVRQTVPQAVLVVAR